MECLIFLNFKFFKNMIVYDVKKYFEFYFLFVNICRLGKGKYIIEKKQVIVIYKNYEVNLY